MLPSTTTQALASRLGEAQNRWWASWFDFLSGAAVSGGAQAAGLWQSSLELWKQSVAATLEAQRDTSRLFASPLSASALAKASEALSERPAASDFEVGDSAAMSKTVTEADIELFALLSGDVNPVHLNDAYAQKTRFGGRIAHGMLSAGLISAVLGTKLPGPGAIYLSQKLEFRAPVLVGDEVTATVTVTGRKEGRPIYTLATVCTKQDGAVVLEGEAVILYEPVG